MKNFKDAIAKRREVALYAKIDSDNWFAIFEISYSSYDERYQALPSGQQREVPMPGWVRISEPFVPELKPVSNEEVVRNAMASLNESERKTLQELNEKLAQIRGRKAQLLALTTDVTVVP